jgi:hypothetical protein
MIFLTGQHHGQDVVLATPSATLRPTKGQSLHQHAMGDTALACFGQIPWIDHQGVQQARRQKSDDVDDDGNDGDSNGSDANEWDGGNNGNNNEGDVGGDDGGDNDYDNDDVNKDDSEGNDGMTTMRCRQRRWNDNNGKATM